MLAIIHLSDTVIYISAVGGIFLIGFFLLLLLIRIYEELSKLMQKTHLEAKKE